MMNSVSSFWGTCHIADNLGLEVIKAVGGPNAFLGIDEAGVIQEIVPAGNCSLFEGEKEFSARVITNGSNTHVIADDLLDSDERIDTYRRKGWKDKISIGFRAKD